MPWNAEAAVEEPLSWQGGAARGLQRSVKAMQADLGLKPSRGRDQHRTPGSLPEALLPALVPALVPSPVQACGAGQGPVAVQGWPCPQRGRPWQTPRGLTTHRDLSLACEVV